MPKLTDFDYEISDDKIAQQPLNKRDESRLLILNKNNGTVEHKQFYQIVEFLTKDDLLVLNNTKVLPARLTGRKQSGGAVEILLLREISPFKWNVLIKASSKPKPGQRIEFDQTKLIGTIIDSPINGQCLMMFSKDLRGFNTQEEFWEILNIIGKPPLPPYIKRKKNSNINDIKDKERYQTVFAKKIGAIAAPTASLHFTEELLESIEKIGVEIVYVTLHVGIGTFKPIKVDDYSKHVMQTEYYEVSKNAAISINNARKKAKRIISVGTTSCRVLETIIKNKASFSSGKGLTNLFIYPPYNIKITNALITNFHQPRTTLLLLVSAFAGKENILKTYEVAKNNGYRFFSYGDCMMII